MSSDTSHCRTHWQDQVTRSPPSQLCRTSKLGWKLNVPSPVITRCGTASRFTRHNAHLTIVLHNNSNTVTCTKQRWHLQISYRILLPKADTPVRTLPIIRNERRVNQPKSYLGLFSPSCVIPHRLAQWQTPTIIGPALTLTSFPSRLKT